MIKFLDIQKITKSFEPELSAAVNRVVERGWFVHGEEVESFEKEYASFIGVKYCIGVANGLDALRLIFKAYIETGVMKEGDEVIMPANTFIASVLAVTDNNLKPVFVEPDINTYNIDLSLIESKITSRTRAIMVVHLYGRVCWDKKLEIIANHYGLKIVEDNAQAAGSGIFRNSDANNTYERIIKASESHLYTLCRTGSLGDSAGHSFYPGKNLGALGDGGAVTTNDKAIADIVRAMANYGFSEKYISDFKGLNSRLDEIQAAVLRVKLKRLDSDNKRRNEVAQYYSENINNPDVILPGSDYPPAQLTKNKNFTPYGKPSFSSLCFSNIWHLFVIRHPERNSLQKFLTQNSIQTLIHYPVPPHKQKAYKEWNELSFPITESIHNQALSLPMSPLLLQEEAENVANTINKFHL
ncbi:MAG: DegT/DnrJ/EryC1/StrS family aminotransferase [Clostridiaceae bacterium]